MHSKHKVAFCVQFLFSKHVNNWKNFKFDFVTSVTVIKRTVNIPETWGKKELPCQLPHNYCLHDNLQVSPSLRRKNRNQTTTTIIMMATRPPITPPIMAPILPPAPEKFPLMLELWFFDISYDVTIRAWGFWSANQSPEQ